MNIPFTAVHFSVYETAKIFLRGHEEESLPVQLIAGGTAGAAAAASTNPLDVVKTRLQLEGVNSATRYNTTSVVSHSSFLLNSFSDTKGISSQVLSHYGFLIIRLSTHAQLWRVQ